ncbi:MAG: hypothetical protein KGI71_05390, partial [Patescibacteria group bacterium]|nr:hypothetical protein [Patescibacteria group bacterium]
MLGVFGWPGIAWPTIAAWAQAVAPTTATAGVSEIAVLFTGAALVYLSRQVLSIGRGVESLNETVSGERGLQSAVTRIEDHYARVNDLVTTVAATQTTMQQ